MIGEDEVAEQATDVEGEVLGADAFGVGDEDIFELEFGDGAEAGEAVEDEEEVEEVEIELGALALAALELEVGEAADH